MKYKSIVFLTLATFFLSVSPLFAQTSSSVCEADINEDTTVDTSDYQILVFDFLSDTPSNPRADVDKSGRVDIQDYVIVVRNFWETCTSTNTPTPSPTATPNYPSPSPQTSPSVSPSPSPTVDADVVIETNGTQYTATRVVDGQQLASSNRAFDAIDAAVNSAANGTVLIKRGLYEIGEDRVVGNINNWSLMTNDASLKFSEENYDQSQYAQITVTDPNYLGKLACHSFNTALSMNDVFSIGFWFQPSVDFSNREKGYDAGSPFNIVLHSSSDCNSPIYTKELYHPEWVTKEWKWYRLPPTPAMSRIPSNVPSVGSVSIEVFDGFIPGLEPSSEYTLNVSRFHLSADEVIDMQAGQKIFGEGSGNTIIRLRDNANIPMILMNRGDSEIAYLELDGQYDLQSAIDQSAGVYNQYKGNNAIHHLYVHNIKGAGLKVKGWNNEIFENSIEWTENGNVELNYTQGSNIVRNNTLKYPLNDDNIWIRSSSDQQILENDIFGVTTAALTLPNAPQSITTIKEWNGIRVDGGSSNVTIQGNRLQDVPGYGIVVANGGGTTIDTTNITVDNNHLYKTVKNALSVQAWGGSGTISNISVTKNYFEGNRSRAMNIGGSAHTISNNWTTSSSQHGLYLTGSNHTGTGNYFDGDSYSLGGNNIGIAASSSGTLIKEFSGGTSW